jgi:hypothetical protein
MASSRKLIEEILAAAAHDIESRVLPIEKGEEFENEAFKVIKRVAQSMGIVNIMHTGAQTFPDIVLDSFGVEVKFSKSKKWESTGNSTFESTFHKEVTQDIYIFFGKKNGDKIHVKFDLYENCLSDVKITHKPRFMINMELDKKETVLTFLELTYEQYRSLPKEGKERVIKSYLKKDLSEGEKILDLDEEFVTNAKIKKFGNLDLDMKRKIIVEMFAYFPAIIGNGNDKYSDAAVYLIKKHMIYAPSLRDLFSAGGQEGLGIKGNIIRCPKKYAKIYHEAKNIEYIILNTSVDELFEYWTGYNINTSDISRDPISTWKKLIDHFGDPCNGYQPSDFFKSGLANSRLSIDN